MWSSTNDLLDKNGRNISISSKVLEEFEFFMRKQEINHDVIDQYFYPSLKLDGILYTYDECEQTFRISQWTMNSLKKVPENIRLAFWKFRSLDNESQNSFISTIEKFNQLKKKEDWKNGDTKFYREILSLTKAPERVETKKKEVPLPEDEAEEAVLPEKQKGELILFQNIITRYNKNGVFQEIDGTYFAKDISDVVLSLVTKMQNQEKDSKWSLYQKLNEHLNAKDKLTKGQLDQLRVILYWYCDRKKKEQKDIASLPNIKLSWYQDNRWDYDPYNGIGKDTYKDCQNDPERYTKSLIEMFSTWIMERVIMFKKDSLLQNIRVISTTLSDDCFSWLGSKGGGIDCIALIDSPIANTNLFQTTPIGIDIVNTLSDDYANIKWLNSTVVPRNFLRSFNAGIWSLEYLDRYLFNIPLNQVVRIFQKFVDSEISNINKNENMDDRLTRQNIWIDRKIMNDLEWKLLESLITQEGIARNIVADVSQASHNILHASGTKLLKSRISL